MGSLLPEASRVDIQQHANVEMAFSNLWICLILETSSVNIMNLGVAIILNLVEERHIILDTPSRAYSVSTHHLSRPARNLRVDGPG